MQRIEINHRFAAPVERVYAYLAEHENLGDVFGARVERVRDGHSARNGTGSVRRLRVAGLPWFEETVTEALPNERIEYRITKGSPLRRHVGTMHFRPSGDGTELRYVIEFGAVLPGLDGLVKPVLERTIRKGLRGVDEKA